MYHQIEAAIPTINAKVAVAKERLASLVPTDACVGHSGGKDSVVTRWLVQSVHPDLPVVHTSKPGGDNAIHPDTLNFLYQLPFAVELWPRALGMNPKYKMQFDGSRISEKNRTDRSADFIKNGKAVNRSHLTFMVPNSMFDMTFVFPIYDWTDADVWACIFLHDIPYSREYTTEAVFHDYYKSKRDSGAAC